MAEPTLRNLLRKAGIDLRRIDSVAQFPMGETVEDHWGQVYKYVKVATDLSISDADVDSIPLTFTYTLDAGTSGLQAGTVNGDGSVNGALNISTGIVAAATASGGRVDAILERRVAGTGVQIDGTPTARYIWVKVKGIANRMLKTVDVDAGDWVCRTLVGGELVELALDEGGAATYGLGDIVPFGFCIAEHTTTAGAGLAGDFKFDVS